MGGVKPLGSCKFRDLFNPLQTVESGPKCRVTVGRAVEHVCSLYVNRLVGVQMDTPS